MKRIRIFAGLLTAFMIILIVVMILEFLATSDIFNEYVSRTVIEHYAPESVDALPSYSANTAEWKVFNFSFLSRIILIITSLVLSISITRRINMEEEAV